MSAGEIGPALQDVEREVAASAPFDLSPRGVRFRPEGELEDRIAAIADRGDVAVGELRRRLDGSPDPFTAIVWLAILTRIGSPEAREVIDEYADRLESSDPWPGAFPGRREVLLFVGRETS